MHLPEQSNYVQMEAGTYTAICIGFFDLGTQEGEYQGEKTSRHQVRLNWEIVGEVMDDGRPYTIGQFYTWSMSDKSKLRHHLEAWRGKPFVKEDLGKGGSFDTKNLLGKPCTLTVVHNDKGYARVGGVGAPMKGVQVNPPINPLQYLALIPERFDQAVFDSLSDKMKAMIQLSPEYADIKGWPVAQRPARTEDAIDDNIPF